ncbi:Nucleic-acid-binding protein from transposon X-element, partial [Camponotus floridanus]
TKSPPIFLDGVENIAPLKQALEVAKDQYVIKILRDNQVKLQSLTTAKYHPIMETLKQKGSQGYSYQCKADKKFKVVLRNMHSTIDINELKKEIEAHNHKVINITNIMEIKTKKPLPLFFIELQQKDNKDIYKIKNLLNTIINFEQPYKKRNIVQCIRYQAYGHSKNYCFRGPRYVKCAEKHLTSACSRKQKFEEVICCNCRANHPANYKGEVRKQLQQRLFPKLREKQ